jgi:hypothetical protein
MASTLDPVEKLFAVYNDRRIARGLEAIVPTQYEMSTPNTYSGPRSPDNTSVKIIPKSATASFGTLYLYYTREDMATVLTATPKVLKGSATTIHQLINEINTELGILSTTADWLDGPLGVKQFVLQATPRNYIFTGSKTFEYLTP